jgi:gas vesicle protein
LFANEAGFTGNEVFNSHNTHIQQHKSGTMQQVLHKQLGELSEHIESNNKTSEPNPEGSAQSTSKSTGAC